MSTSTFNKDNYIPKSLYLDFEFNRTNNSPVNLVSCATMDRKNGQGQTLKWWLHNDKAAQESFKKYLSRYKVFISYSAIAECRSFIALGLNPLDYEWVDLYLEYRMLLNHNDDMQWGPQLGPNNKVVEAVKPKPKWERTEEDSVGGFKHTYSLAEASYKLLGVHRDVEHKDKMRDLILKDLKVYPRRDQFEIMNYGIEDVKNLPAIHDRILEEFRKKDASNTSWTYESILRGRYSALTSIMEEKGYPINFEGTKNFSSQCGNILFDCQREINELFPMIKPFRWDRKTNRYTWDQLITRKWIQETGHSYNWMRTDGGDLSLSLEAFEEFFPFKHSYPTDNFGAQMVRFLKLKQSLYGFLPPRGDKVRKNFWDYVGPDQRVRPYFNIYGSQSSRSQPAATGFMALKPAWMRTLIAPSKGFALGSIDYGSQEFFISALLAEDEEMIKAYLSGDVYLAFAISSGMVPPTATKETHKKERNLAKSLVLGMSYRISKVGLARHLSAATGEIYTEDQAQEFIDIFYDTYKEFSKWQKGLEREYKSQGFFKLPCGWYLWGDNDNHRSYTNFPVQGFGASIMRRAVQNAFKEGLHVSFTLHDAIYIEYPSNDRAAMDTLKECMVEAFTYYFPEDLKKYAVQVRLDPYTWSPDFEKDSELIFNGYKVPASNEYVDERAVEELEKFRVYFEPRLENEL